MSADIESFASYREPAWHGLGTVFTEPVTTQEMLELANMANWNPRMVDEILPEGWTTVDPMRYVVRDNPFTGQPEILGHARSRYEVVSNEELFSLADGIMEADPETTWETAGSLKGGQVVFGSMSMTRSTVLDPTGVADKVETYLLVTSSYDGTGSLVATLTPTRVVCANTLAIALKGATNKFKMRHTQSVTGRIAEARDTLGMASAYMDEFDALAQTLFEREITDNEFSKIIAAAYPRPEDNDRGQQTKYDNKVDGIWNAYRGDFNLSTGNAWYALNGIYDALDWNRTQRFDSKTGKSNNEQLLMDASGMSDSQNAEKARLLSVVQSVLS